MRILQDIQKEKDRFVFIYRTSESETETISVSQHEFEKMQALLKRASLAAPGMTVSEVKEPEIDLEACLDELEKKVKKSTRKEMEIVKDDYQYVRELVSRTLSERTEIWNQLHKQAAVKLRTLENYFNASQLVEKNIIQKVDSWHNHIQDRLKYLSEVIQNVLKNSELTEQVAKDTSNSLHEEVHELKKTFDKVQLAISTEFELNQKKIEALKKEARLNIQTDIMNKVSAENKLLADAIRIVDAKVERTKEATYRRVKRLTRIETMKQEKTAKILMDHVDRAAKGIREERSKLNKLIARETARRRGRKRFWFFGRRK